MNKPTINKSSVFFPQYVSTFKDLRSYVKANGVYKIFS